VFVSHELSQIREICTRAVVVADHRAAFVGAVPDAIAHYAALAAGAHG